MVAIKQATDNCTVRTGANFAAIGLGPWSELDQYTLEVPAIKRETKGKVFAKELLAFTGMQISANSLPPHASLPFTHQHKENEEAYIIVGGKGEMLVDGEQFPVSEGSIIRIDTAGERSIRNTGSEPLYFICVQARANSLSQHTFEDGIKGEAPPVWKD